ncbi:hypothetical protein NOF04DRAFT_5178 [Fusarium oxysporum II5]|uniref:Uncharacterized protein n=2 Tax=Fusarium oxysporum species complex TaxID=171631 RepID=X0KS27_FUSO5|nr:uncharacterized protein FOIG_08622 [Fusarium odoratissimum NRRL 54006]EXL99584.1 hypothetical protein FOIG_08622 [Fusarium odoratissimum NRRL 54006]KAK2125121.1 hypothetical protein NOF04DRAFT_5178 [Fusarium oxysporum II5]TXC03061.1 hypothetical protein FocTR4_00015525 [Fusarium oxysporum f. sp. cubense]
MCFEAPPVPAPQNEHAKRTNELFTVFYEELGKWPWEVISFGPRKWGQKLVSGFTRLLSVDLPKTDGVTLEQLIDFLHDHSADHTMPQYRYQLSMKLIAKATKWLADKRELPSAQPHDSDSDSDSDGSILNEPQNVTRNKARARALHTDTRTAPIRTARKRPIDYSERRYFQLHNVDGPEDDGAEDGGNEEIQEEVELEPAEPPAKKRLMVFFNFSPENTQELSKLMGDYITGPGNPRNGNGNVEASRHSIPQRNAPGAGEKRLLDTPNQSLNEVQLAYAEHLKREIMKLEEDISRTEANISNSSRRRVGYLETVRSSAEALEQATKEATKASQVVQHARARCEADAQVVEELRRISSDNPGILTAEIVQNIEKNTPAQKEKREAELNLRNKEKRLNDLRTKTQMAEANVDPLNSKISELSDVLHAKKNARRSLVAIHRLVAMGGKELKETLGEKGLEEWAKEQNRSER